MRFKLTRGTTLFSILTLLVVVAACGNATEESESSGTTDQTVRRDFRWGAPGNAQSLDPHNGSPYDVMYLTPVYEALIKPTAEGDLSPGLATDWSVSSDGTTLELTLRSGVNFQDGTEFDAAAVKANLKRGQQEGSTVASQLSAISRVEVVDNRNVNIHMSSAQAGFLLQVLSHQAGMMVSPTAATDESTNLKKNPVGTGPFKLESRVPGEAVYKAWDGYWNAENIHISGIKEIVYKDKKAMLRAIDAGQLDAGYDHPESAPLAKSLDLTVSEAPSGSIDALWLNTTNEPLSDPLVRKALNKAIDRKTITSTFYNGGCDPIVQPFSKNSWAHVPELENHPSATYDVARAKQLLAQAGYPDGFSIKMISGPSETHKGLATILQEQFKKIGVEVDFTAQDNTQLLTDLAEGRYETVAVTTKVATPGASALLNDFYLPEGSHNPGDFTLPGLDDLVAQSKAGIEPAERRQPVAKIMEKVLEAGPPMLPICSTKIDYFFDPSVVSNLQAPVNGNYNFNHVKLLK